MNRKDTQTYQMLTHVVDFGTRNVGLFPKTSAAAGILKTLEKGVATLSDQAGIWVAAKSETTTAYASRVASRETLKDLLSRAAQLSLVLQTTPIRLPNNVTDQQLIDAGRGFLRTGGPTTQDYVDHGLSATFADDLVAAIQDLEKGIQDCRDAKGRRMAVLEKWLTLLQESMNTLFRFDVLVSNTLKDDRAAMASYALARAVRRVGGHKVSAASPPTATPAPVPEEAPTPAPATASEVAA